MPRNLILTDSRDNLILRKYLDSNQRTISKAVNALWEKQRKAITGDTVQRAIQKIAVPDEWSKAWEDLTHEFVLNDIVPEWGKAIKSGGGLIEQRVRKLQTKQYDFDPTDITVKTWIDKSGGELIVDLTAGQMKSVQALLQHQIAVMGITSPYILAQRIRPIVGLTLRESLAVSKFMTSLMEEGVSAAALNSQVEKYAAFLHKNRAARIARTELSNAYNFGQRNSVQQAFETGWLPGEPMKSWMAGGINPCEICEGNEAEGEIPLDQTFSSGHDQPTAHPHCECSLSYSVRRTQ